jgi:hypothetical protein
VRRRGTADIVESAQLSSAQLSSGFSVLVPPLLMQVAFQPERANSRRRPGQSLVVESDNGFGRWLLVRSGEASDKAQVGGERCTVTAYVTPRRVVFEQPIIVGRDEPGSAMSFARDSREEMLQLSID